MPGVAPDDNKQRESAPRAGRYITQPTGYKAFIPAPLPPNPAVKIDDELLSLLSNADRELGRLDGATEILPNPDLFVLMYIRKEAVLSSQIEGTQASLVDVLAFEAQALQAGSPQDVEEVINYQEAMSYGLKGLARLPLSLRLIQEIHAKLLSGVRGSEKMPGEFRRSQNWIGPANSSLTSAQFVPPPPADMETALGNWEVFLHSEEPMPFLLKVGMAHAQFETIHPFLDGNGRIGRLLITFMLCEREILRRPLLYLSYFFKKHRSEYYERLQRTREAGDWEGWLKFFLRGVAEVAHEATETARKIVSLREAHRELVLASLGRNAATGLELLESLFFQPYGTVAAFSEKTGLTFANTNKLVTAMREIGILQETTGQRRNRVFQYHDYMKLFV